MSKSVRVTITLRSGESYSATFPKLPPHWKSAAMRLAPYGSDLRGATFSRELECPREVETEAQCEECERPATHLSGIGNGYLMRLCADHTNERVAMYAASPQPCKQPWFRTLEIAPGV